MPCPPGDLDICHLLVSLIEMHPIPTSLPEVPSREPSPSGNLIAGGIFALGTQTSCLLQTACHSLPLPDRRALLSSPVSNLPQVQAVPQLALLTHSDNGIMSSERQVQGEGTIPITSGQLGARAEKEGSRWLENESPAGPSPSKAP